MLETKKSTTLTETIKVKADDTEKHVVYLNGSIHSGIGNGTIY